MIDRIVRSEPLVAPGKSGAALERAWLDDGTQVVVKHLEPTADWVMQATGDVARVVDLWDEGVFSRMPAAIDHAILAAERILNGGVVVMRDVGRNLFDGRSPSRADHLQVLRAIDEMHRSFTTCPQTELCPLSARVAFLAPAMWEPFVGVHDIATTALDGWERFHEIVDEDISIAIARVHADASLLVAALEPRRATLVHGDLKLDNLGINGDSIVVIDWGTLTTWAPAAFDFAWYIALNAAALRVDHDTLLEDVCAVQGESCDETAMYLSLLAVVAQIGWEKALGATSDDETVRQRELDGLVWWQAKARTALEELPGG